MIQFQMLEGHIKQKMLIGWLLLMKIMEKEVQENMQQCNQGLFNISILKKKKKIK